MPDGPLRLEIGPTAHTGTNGARGTSAGGGPRNGSVPLVTGPAHELLAWLLGRSAGEGLAVRLASAVPVMPPWR